MSRRESGHLLGIEVGKGSQGQRSGMCRGIDRFSGALWGGEWKAGEEAGVRGENEAGAGPRAIGGGGTERAGEQEALRDFWAVEEGKGITAPLCRQWGASPVSKPVIQLCMYIYACIYF